MTFDHDSGCKDKYSIHIFLQPLSTVGQFANLRQYSLHTIQPIDVISSAKTDDKTLIYSDGLVKAQMGVRSHALTC